MFDTICSIATTLGVGAISIIRVSGKEAISIVNNIFKGKDLEKVESHTIHYGHIVYEEKVIDEVLVSVMKAPKTYTTEDVVEINCHGGIQTTNKILEILLLNGCRQAEAGEFTKRAFLNGRIDLMEAEAVMDLINSQNDLSRQIAINELQGYGSNLIKKLREDLINIISNIEVNIDYPEYDDVEVLTNEKILPRAKHFLERINKIIEEAQNASIIKNGIDTVILGKPNVGKSSLLNALLQEDKAIVTDVAGTTRDLVEGVVNLGQVTLNLIDTAGIRDTQDVVEKIGIEKSKEALNKAKLVIMVMDASNISEEDEMLLELCKDKPCILVYNKADKQRVNDGINISAINNDIDELIVKINEMFEQAIIDNRKDTLNNERQIGLAMQARSHMEDVLVGIENNVELDLVSIDLNLAYESLKEILGKANREDLLDALFSKFCLGK